MPSQKLMLSWWLLNVTLLAAGIVTLALSIVWRQPDILMNLVLPDMDLTVGLVLGAFFLVTWAFSIGAVIQKNHITIGLALLNWILIVAMLYLTAAGSVIWFFTLRIRNNFHTRWSQQTPSTRIAIQDMFKCCGYFNGTDLVEMGGTFCADPNFVAQTQSFCVTPITQEANDTLNPIFSTVYGFMAILLCFFMATLCVINERKKEERFKKIDAKRGGRGFV
ncbi:tetraspanin Pls1 family [Thelephora terrestris]|jgi:hypothetical protein|uniref:Tetraspanin Pls1 family n=1 Tax=Thelephora terrestris TaxID=56493 RepID=A0A9P6HPW2_9AGAM|nr:tetraspanin Pls1 family [Thelephora terrestris]